MKPIARPPAPKRRYTTPHLVAHGDLKAMTQSKKGSASDGGSKPKTHLAGSGATA